MVNQRNVKCIIIHQRICFVNSRDRGMFLLYMQRQSLAYFKGTDHVGTFMGLKCVVYYANYRSGNQSSKIQVVP